MVCLSVHTPVSDARRRFRELGQQSLAGAAGITMPALGKDWRCESPSTAATSRSPSPSGSEKLAESPMPMWIEGSYSSLLNKPCADLPWKVCLGDFGARLAASGEEQLAQEQPAAAPVAAPEVVPAEFSRQPKQCQWNESCSASALPPPPGLEDDLDLSSLSALDAELAEAVGCSDLVAVQRCLQNGGNANLTTSGGKPLLFYAVMRAKGAELIKVLVEAGADVHQRDEFGNEVMHLWARATRARDELLALGIELLRSGANVNCEREDGMTPLHLLVAGHNSHRGWLDFHKAALLLRHGAKPDVQAPCGRRPIDMMKQNQRLATARFIELLHSKSVVCNTKDCSWCQ